MNDKTVESIRRPQEPQMPFPYRHEEVYFENKKDQILLSGTLTIPESTAPYPVVILIPGYGPLDRDMTTMGHKYFLVLADYLTRRDFAVLRYDKRGVGKSTGSYQKATSKDFAGDVESALDYLSSRGDIDRGALGLAGLSEGGLIGSMVASERNIRFLILLAPAVITSIEDLLDMTGLQMEADGASEDLIAGDRTVRRTVLSCALHEQDTQKAERVMRSIIEDYVSALSDDQKEEAEMIPFAFTSQKAEKLIQAYTSPWFRFFLRFDPVPVLSMIKAPVLVLNGDKDWIACITKSFPLLEKTFSSVNKTNYMLKQVQGGNHLFQTCKTGALSEYSLIEETISPVVLDLIADWIGEQLKT